MKKLKNFGRRRKMASTKYLKKEWLDGFDYNPNNIFHNEEEFKALVKERIDNLSEEEQDALIEENGNVFIKRTLEHIIEDSENALDSLLRRTLYVVHDDGVVDYTLLGLYISEVYFDGENVVIIVKDDKTGKCGIVTAEYGYRFGGTMEISNCKFVNATPCEVFLLKEFD